MGQAKRRGTFEERQAMRLRELQAEADAAYLVKRKKYEEECRAWDCMTEEQIDQSYEREQRIRDRRTSDQIALASLLGMAYGGGWGAFGSMYR